MLQQPSSSALRMMQIILNLTYFLAIFNPLEKFQLSDLLKYFKMFHHLFFFHKQPQKMIYGRIIKY